MADFAELETHAEFRSAWSQIATQLNAEGASGLDLQAAQDTLVKSYTDLTTGQLAVDTTAALNAAKDFTLTAKTVMGAVDMAQGMIAAAKGASTPAQVAAVANMFTGTLVAVTVFAGAVSAGLGSLIVAGVGIVLSILGDLGLFGDTGGGYNICGATSSNAPSILVGCAFSPTASRTANGAASWRSFPASAEWFDPFFVSGGFSWYGDPWFTSAVGHFGQPRAIDLALPDYSRLEAEIPVWSDDSPLANFRRAFFTAWKANKEYAFNGLKVQDDWQVLTHVVRVWNKAHLATSTYDLGLGDGVMPYEASLLSDALNNLSANDATNNLVNGKFRINTGALQTSVPRKVIIRITVPLNAATAPAGAMSTTTKVVLGTSIVAGSALAGTALYAALKHRPFLSVWSKLIRRR